MRLEQTMKLRHFLLCGALAMIGAGAMAQSGTPTGTPAAVAAKVQLRGDANDIVIPEMRIVRRNDVMVVQADMKWALATVQTLGKDVTVQPGDQIVSRLE